MATLLPDLSEMKERGEVNFATLGEFQQQRNDSEQSVEKQKLSAGQKYFGMPVLHPRRPELDRHFEKISDSLKNASGEGVVRDGGRLSSEIATENPKWMSSPEPVTCNDAGGTFAHAQP